MNKKLVLAIIAIIIIILTALFIFGGFDSDVDEISSDQDIQGNQNGDVKNLETSDDVFLQINSAIDNLN